jgi:hypothetical protein
MRHFLAISLLLTLPAARVKAEDEVLPTSHPVSRYTEIWENSPFNREVIKVASEAITSSFAQTLTLEGIVNDDSIGPIAYVRDNAENQPIVITSAKSESHPYTIVSANLVNNPEETKVTLTDGKETGEIGYVVAKLTQPIQQFQPQAQPQDPRARSGNKGAPPAPPSSPDAAAAAAAANRPDAPRIPGNALNPANNAKKAEQPASVTPALDKLDDEPRRRRVPLPGQ